MQEEIKLNWKEKLVIRIIGILYLPVLYASNKSKGKSIKESWDRAKKGYG